MSIADKNRFERLALDFLNEMVEETSIAGLSVAITKDSRLIFSGASGQACVEDDRPVTSKTIFPIASITKTLTAAAILRVSEAHKSLTINSRLGDFFDGFPESAARITVEQMLRHTCGLADFVAVGADYHALERRGASQEEIIALFRNRPLHFPPGRDFSYCNSGYFLLGNILEIVTGLDYLEVLRRYVMLGGLEEQIGIFDLTEYNGARGYVARIGDDGGLSYVRSSVVKDSVAFSAGALCSPAPALARWADALFSGEFLTRRSLAFMTSPGTLSNGAVVPYGAGLFLGRIDGRAVFHHAGNTRGFASQLTHIPEEGLTVVVLTNTQGVFPHRVTNNLLRLYREEAGLPPHKNLPGWRAADLSPLVGIYLLSGITEQFRTRVELQLRDNTLVLVEPETQWELIHRGSYEFEAAADRDVSLHFVNDEENPFSSFVLTRQGASLGARRVPW